MFIKHLTQIKVSAEIHWAIYYNSAESYFLEDFYTFSSLLLPTYIQTNKLCYLL